MNGKLYAVLGVSLLLPACFSNAHQNENKHTFFIQAPLDSEAIKNVQASLKQVVDKIILQELSIKQDKGFPIFVFKSRQAITIYYVNDLYDNNEPLAGLMYLFVEPALDSLKASAPQKVALTAKTDFFGVAKKGLFAAIDLVAHIDDPDGELVLLNKEMKKAMHHANKEYKRAYHIDLYDIAKSERHGYLPHITLGHLRMNYLKFLVNDSSKEDKVVERIKQRIAKAVSDAISNLSPNDRKLSFDNLAIYNAKKKKYIHKRPLK